MRVKGKYPDEFKAAAVELIYSSGQSVRHVATRLGVNFWTLRDWYRADKVARAKKSKKKKPKVRIQTTGEVSESESLEARAKRLERENATLRKKVAQLEMDREILKKVAAFSVKESE